MTLTGNRLDRDIHHDRLWCHRCRKWTYPSRKVARRVRKTVNPGDPMDTYRCRRGGGWHIGHPREREKASSDDDASETGPERPRTHPPHKR